MTRFLVCALGVLALAVVGPSSALAKRHHHHHAKTKVLRASLAPVSPDASAYTIAGGRAHLVVNRRKAKVSIHVHGLLPKTTSAWAITTGGCTGPAVPNFTYKPLKTNHKGRGNAHGASKNFMFSKTTTYSAVVYAANGTDPVLCGAFVRKR